MCLIATCVTVLSRPHLQENARLLKEQHSAEVNKRTQERSLLLATLTCADKSAESPVEVAKKNQAEYAEKQAQTIRHLKQKRKQVCSLHVVKNIGQGRTQRRGGQEE